MDSSAVRVIGARVPSGNSGPDAPLPTPPDMSVASIELLRAAAREIDDDPSCFYTVDLEVDLGDGRAIQDTRWFELVISPTEVTEEVEDFVAGAKQLDAHVREFIAGAVERMREAAADLEALAVAPVLDVDEVEGIFAGLSLGWDMVRPA